MEVSAQHNELSSFDILVYQRFASTSQQIAGCADRHKVNPTDADRLDIVGQRFAGSNPLTPIVTARVRTSCATALDASTRTCIGTVGKAARNALIASTIRSDGSIPSKAIKSSGSNTWPRPLTFADRLTTSVMIVRVLESTVRPASVNSGFLVLSRFEERGPELGLQFSD